MYRRGVRHMHMPMNPTVARRHDEISFKMIKAFPHASVSENNGGTEYE